MFEKEIEIQQEIVENETGVYFGRITGEKGINQYGENTYLTREYVAPTLGNGNTYIVEKASKVIFQADSDSYYGYGTISSTDASVTVPKTCFAVVSNNQEINNAFVDGMNMEEDCLIRVFKRSVGNKRQGYAKALEKKGMLVRDSSGTYIPTDKFRRYC